MKTLGNPSILVVLAGLIAAAVGSAQGPPQGPPPPPEVAVITVQPKTVPVSYDYVGVTETSKTVEVRARIQGFLETRDFDEGAFIKEGTKLFTIDRLPFQADLEIAVAGVEQAETRLKLAGQDVERLQSVKVPGAIAETDLDQALAEQADAAASLKLARAQQAKAELELGYTTIKAPLTGFVGKAERDIGSLVDAGQNSLLTVMRQVDPIYVSFRVSERDFLAWRREVRDGTLVLAEGDQPYLTVTLLDGSEYGQRGTLNFESTNVDIQTGTVELRGTFANPDNLLKPGQFVNAHIEGWVRPDTITVPQRAVSQSPQGAYVYVIGDDNKAELRVIKPGAWTGRDWIIEGGIKSGERVVVEGLLKVQPGIEVKPVPFTESSEAEKAQS